MHHRHDRHHVNARSTGQLPEAASPPDAPQILPRFMLPGPSRSPTTLVFAQQAARAQHAFEGQRDERQRRRDTAAREDGEIARRTDATRLRSVQERAQRAVDQRELDAFLQMQIEAKRCDAAARRAQDRAARVDVDAVRALPRDPVVAPEQRRAAQLKLRGRLDEQVADRHVRERQRHAVERAESAFFMAAVAEQHAREQQQTRERKRIARDALTDAWRQQQAMRE